MDGIPNIYRKQILDVVSNKNLTAADKHIVAAHARSLGATSSTIVNIDGSSPSIYATVAALAAS